MHKRTSYNEFIAKEYEHFGIILQKLLGSAKLHELNQMPNFGSIVLTLGQTTFNLAKQLRLLAIILIN